MIRRQIPNLLTLCNLTCGVVATYMAVGGALHLAALCMLGGILFDFFDGFAARLLHVASPIGKELDSLADVVTSGVAPAIILFKILELNTIWYPLSYFAFLMPAFSAYRLAKFNLDTRQIHSFLGLPVPSNAMIWAALGICIARPEWALVALLPMQGLDGCLTSNAMLVVLCVVSLCTDMLMVSQMPMMSLKVKSYSWRDSKMQYLLLIGALVLIVLCGVLGIALAIVWYIALSFILSRSYHDDREA